MKKAPEQFRINKNPFVTDGNNGQFKISHYKIAGYTFFCIISDGFGWEHVSVTLRNGKKTVERCCTWEEMCFIKDIFFESEETVIQFHPPKSMYVSTHPYCLHLWKPTNFKIPIPETFLVGAKGDNVQSL